MYLGAMPAEVEKQHISRLSSLNKLTLQDDQLAVCQETNKIGYDIIIVINVKFWVLVIKEFILLVFIRAIPSVQILVHIFVMFS